MTSLILLNIIYIFLISIFFKRIFYLSLSTLVPPNLLAKLIKLQREKRHEFHKMLIEFEQSPTTAENKLDAEHTRVIENKELFEFLSVLREQVGPSFIEQVVASRYCDVTLEWFVMALY